MFVYTFYRMVIDTPTGLQQFLFWNIVRHLHVGGRDKLAALRKADFIFTDDRLGNRYVRVVRFRLLNGYNLAGTRGRRSISLPLFVV